MVRPIPEGHALHRIFQGVTEYTFTSVLGIADPALVDYVAQLLLRFVPSESIWSMRNTNGERLDTVTAMMAEAQSSPDEARARDCYRHVGDYTLFWLGVYPEALEQLRKSRSVDFAVQYRHQGKRSYLLASTMQGNQDEAAVYRRLSEEFELCTYGLSRVRKEWERQDPDPRRDGKILPPII